MKKLFAVAAIAGLLGSTAAFADAGADLAKAKNCLACHAVDKKLVGPAYKDVAAKYKGDKTAEAKLIEKVQKGGVGAWGQIPMPPTRRSTLPKPRPSWPGCSPRSKPVGLRPSKASLRAGFCAFWAGVAEAAESAGRVAPLQQSTGPRTKKQRRPCPGFASQGQCSPTSR
jgi:cytochrome c